MKIFLPSLFSRSESENQMTQNRDREVNFQKNSREFSRIETLAGHCIKMYYAALYCIENVHYTEFRANDASANIIVRGAQQITKPTRWSSS